MPRIRIGVQGKVATNLMPDEKIVCRNSDYQVEFEFDETWGAHELKTALVVYNGGSVAVPFKGAVCDLPTIYSTNMCAIGVFAGDLVTTTPAYVECEKSIGDLAKYEIEEPPVDAYNQLVQMIESGMLKGDAGKSVLYYDGVFGKDSLDDILVSTANMNGVPNVGDLVITSDGVLCEVAMVIDEHACMLAFLAFLRGEKGEKGEKGDAGSIKFIMVSVLPISGIDPTAIYLVPQVGSVEGNMYDEFIYAHGAWEKLGGLTVNVDHSEYVKFTDYASLNKAGVVKIDDGAFKQFVVDSDGFLKLYPAPTGAIDSRAGDMPITISKLDYAVISVMTGYNRAVLTEEQQATALNWLGATDNFVAKNAPQGTAVKLYGESSEGNVVHRIVNVAATPTQGAIPIYRENGVLPAGTPKEPYHATNKEYVDTKIGDIETVLDGIIAIQNTLIGGGV